MLDGRVLGASQVEYKTIWETPSKERASPNPKSGLGPDKLFIYARNVKILSFCFFLLLINCSYGGSGHLALF